MSYLLNTLSSILNVPPYTSLDITISSPGLKRLTTVDIAARPDANAKPNLPFSSSAISSSRAFLVGLPLLEYSQPLCLPGTSCPYVLV